MAKLKKTTIIFKLDPRNPEEKILDYAAAAIRGGKLVAFPTETVYGIAANRLDKKAINDLRRAKNRPEAKPFTVHISDVAMIRKMGVAVTSDASKLIKKFWPGPLTIILKAKNGERIGFRMPANKIAIQLIEAAQTPIVAPSANLSGKKAPVEAKKVFEELYGRIDLILDGGRTRVGVESTVVDMTSNAPEILRDGAISDKVRKFLDI
jgi:L-threonylcarbamoyladenylate synthase